MTRKKFQTSIRRELPPLKLDIADVLPILVVYRIDSTQKYCQAYISLVISRYLGKELSSITTGTIVIRVQETKKEWEVILPEVNEFSNTEISSQFNFSLQKIGIR